MNLIARLKAATGPDRQLDGEIFQAIGGDTWEAAIARAELPSGCPRDMAEEGARRLAPHFTGSVDAAMSLLPPWSWRVGNLPSGGGFADLGTQASLQCVEGATPAIALTTACVIARDSHGQPSPQK